MTKGTLGLCTSLALFAALAQPGAMAGAGRRDAPPTGLTSLPQPGVAKQAAATNATVAPAAVSLTNAPTAKPTPGVEAAQAISTITGVAISPLLGVGAVGAV